MDNHSHLSANMSSTGYGPSMYSNLVFDGDEAKFEQWEVKFMSYMRIKKLHDVFTTDGVPDKEKNEQAFAELTLYIDSTVLISSHERRSRRW